MNRLYRVTVSEETNLTDYSALCNYYKKIEIGCFDIKAKNAEQAKEKALTLAEVYKIPNPIITNIDCLDKVFVING